LWFGDTDTAHCPGFGQDRTIFTRSQEGTQPGRLTQTGQTNGVLDTMCCHAGFCVGELSCGLGARWASGGERVALSIPLTFLYSLLIGIAVVSFAVLLNCPHPDPGVLPFLPILHPTPARGGVVLCCWPGLNHDTR